MFPHSKLMNVWRRNHKIRYFFLGLLTTTIIYIFFMLPIYNWTGPVVPYASLGGLVLQVPSKTRDNLGRHLSIVLNQYETTGLQQISTHSLQGLLEPGNEITLDSDWLNKGATFNPLLTQISLHSKRFVPNTETVIDIILMVHRRIRAQQEILFLKSTLLCPVDNSGS